ISAHPGAHTAKLTIQNYDIAFDLIFVPRPPTAKKTHTLIARLGLPPFQAELHHNIDYIPWRNILNIKWAVRTIGRKQHDLWKILAEVNIILEEQYPLHVQIYTDGSHSRDTNSTAADPIIQAQPIAVRTRLQDGCYLYTAECWTIHQSISVLTTPELEETLMTLLDLEIKQVLVNLTCLPPHINLIGNDKVDAAIKL
ncbi:hypothetical protein CHS0354_014881, partial [Potamilus streckersoni]